MEVMVLDLTDDIEMLRELGNEWAEFAKQNEFALPIDVNIGLKTMGGLASHSLGDALVLVDGDQVKGFLGISYRLNHVGPGKIANECCFFITPSARGFGGKCMKNYAEKLAKAKGCNFFIWNASKIAGDANRSGKFYEKTGGKQFETSYLKAL